MLGAEKVLFAAHPKLRLVRCCHQLVASNEWGGPIKMSHLEMQRSDGSNIPLANLTRQKSSVTIPARGALDLDVCTNGAPNNYGVVTVTASTPNTIIGTMLRQGSIDHYRFPTPLR